MEQHIAAYYRLSLEDFDLKKNVNKDESNSIWNQRKLIRNYIEDDSTLQKLPVSEFVDDGFTGTNFERPSFQNMLELIKKGKISCVIVKDLSRFGRNYLEVGDYLEHLFPFLGIRFIAVNDGYDSEDYVGSNLGIDVAFKNILHDYYSRDLSKKVKDIQRCKMLTGKYVTVPPFGYMRDPEDKHHLIINEEAALVVREIFTRIIAGESTSDVARYMNKHQIPTPLQASGRARKKGMLCEKDLMWNHVTVLNILSNYKYTGAMVNHTRENATMRAKNQRRVPKDEWIINEGMHEAIVSHQEFHEARMALRKVRSYERKEPDDTDCVYYCGHCGRRLRKTYGNYTYLSCQTSVYIPDAECKGIKWTLPELEKVVNASFNVQMLFVKKVKKQMLPEKVDKSGKFIREMAKIKNMMDSCESKKSQLYMDYRTGIISREAFISKKSDQVDLEDSLKKKMLQARDDYERYLEGKAEEEERIEVINQYTQFAEMTDEQMRKLMYHGIDRVLVYKDGSLDIQWKFSDVFEYYQKKLAG